MLSQDFERAFRGVGGECDLQIRLVVDQLFQAVQDDGMVIDNHDS